ncbi:MAG: peptide chain release factor N(5)-glutamine methyltransferase, partial [Clostridium sp.]|nr:peptide chain release factor N(5)-glutamine methyltransferase [Clostridium sp.]
NENRFRELIKKRKEKMPMAYILKDVEFMGLDFYVEEGVLIPRGDTEILVEEVLNHIGQEESINICDLCCGSGAIGISLASLRNNIKVDLVDLYPIPEKVTKKNIEKHSLEERAEFIKSDLLNKVIESGKKYDILVSNPPYIADKVIDTLMDDVKNYEPHTALAGGEEGMDFYNIIVSESCKVLNEKGILAFEIGYDQGEKVKKLMEEKGFNNVKIIQDLAGLDRVVIGNF